MKFHLFGLRALVAASAGPALTALLVACGGGGGDSPVAPTDPNAVQLDSARTASARIGTAGGSVSATAADGRVYTLTIPAGALAQEAEVTATPVSSMGNAPLAAGLKAAVRFGPAGLKFGVPATLRIEGAASTAATGKRLVGFVRADNGAAMSLVPPATVGTALELQVLHFSDVGVSEGSLEEIALVPIVTPASIAEELLDAAVRALPLAPSTQQVVDAMARLHDDIVLPELDAATTLNNTDARLVAAAAFGAWQLAIAGSTLDEAQRQAVIAGLADRFTVSRARAGGFLKFEVDAGLTRCNAPAPVGATQLEGLRTALAIQAVASNHTLDGADLGLDDAGVALRANACARVAFEPKALPTLEVGRAVSLDAKAVLIFAADATVNRADAFEFVVTSSSAAIATPSGFGDAGGNYTTVVTPSAAKPAFVIKACLMVPLPLPGGGVVKSGMCAQDTVGGEAGVILAGKSRIFSFGADPSNPEGVAPIGEVSLRVRVDSPDLTVTQALGQYRGSFVSRQSCRRSDGSLTPEVALSTSFTGSITDGRVPFPTLELQSREVVVRERFTTDGRCDITTQTTTTDLSILLIISSVVRAAGNSIVALELASFGLPSGRLDKE